MTSVASNWISTLSAKSDFELYSILYVYLVHLLNYKSLTKQAALKAEAGSVASWQSLNITSVFDASMRKIHKQCGTNTHFAS